VLSPLPAGEYSITITANGFQMLVQEKVVVDALSSVGFNATLTVGAATEQVTVSAAPPPLNTVDASMAYICTRCCRWQSASKVRRPTFEEIPFNGGS
jgi:hypothetical protein